MSHGSIRLAAPTGTFLSAFAAAKVKAPVSAVAATATASPILRKDVISPP
jgi:hypothetical protein